MEDQTDHHLDYLLTEPMKAGVMLMYMLSLVAPVALIGLIIWGLVELVKWLEGVI